MNRRNLPRLLTLALCVLLPYCSSLLGQSEGTTPLPQTTKQETVPQQTPPQKSPTVQKSTKSPLFSLDEENDNKKDDRFLSDFMNMLMTLGFIVVLMVIMGWVMKRIMVQRTRTLNTSSAIKVVERRTLGPKSAIYLLDVLGKGIVVAESPAGIHPIAQLAEGTDLSSLDTANEPPQGRTFSQFFEKKMGSKNENSDTRSS